MFIILFIILFSSFMAANVFQAQLLLDEKSNLVVQGYNLDMGDYLNSKYKINIVGEDGAKRDCKLMKVSNLSMECQPTSIEGLKTEDIYFVHVSTFLRCICKEILSKKIAIANKTGNFHELILARGDLFYHAESLL
mgnify:FL=1